MCVKQSKNKLKVFTKTISRKQFSYNIAVSNNGAILHIKQQTYFMKMKFIFGLMMLLAFSIASFADVGNPPKFKTEKSTVINPNVQGKILVIPLFISDTVLNDSVVNQNEKEVVPIISVLRLQERTKMFKFIKDVGWMVNDLVGYSTLNTSEKQESVKYRNCLKSYCSC
jgi:hypothetical protein